MCILKQVSQLILAIFLKHVRIWIITGRWKYLTQHARSAQPSIGDHRAFRNVSPGSHSIYGRYAQEIKSVQSWERHRYERLKQKTENTTVVINIYL